MLMHVVPVSAQILSKIQNAYGTTLRSIRTTLYCHDTGTPAPAMPHLDGSSARYLEEMYNAWLKDPKSVHISWDIYFRSEAYTRPPTFSPNTIGSMSGKGSDRPAIAVTPQMSSATASSQTIEDHMKVQDLIKSYQVRGHLVAKLNPLEEMYDIDDKTTTISGKTGKLPQSIVRHHDISPSIFNQTFQLPSTTLIGGKDRQLTLSEIVKRLELTYCRHIGLEYGHITDAEQCEWIKQQFEVPGSNDLKKPEKRLMLTRLAKAVLFEGFLKKKFSSEKRFGLEGCEVLIPCMKAIIDEYAKKDAEMAIIGMAHRGRLNVLANVCHKPLFQLFAQFRGLKPEDEGAGDVKYHLGVYDKRVHPATNKPFITILVANPSHLEMVNPIVAGRTKAEQFYKNDLNGHKVIPLLIHGDAAICGEGIVYETINFANLPHFSNGGTIHFVVNNQVGFTTDPPFSRSSYYCTEVGKGVGAPIFHVNADDPESALYVAKVAAKWRSKFHKDVVIDLIGYRRHGHNEADEPMFTQPIMYTHIKKMPNIFEKYAQVANKTGVSTEKETKSFVDEFEKRLEDEFMKAGKEKSVRFADWIDSLWPNFFKNKDPTKCEPTGVSMDILKHVGQKFCEPPPGGFELHKAILRIFGHRKEMVNNHTADWSIGEALAIGTLVKEGIHVRLSGQDVERGTFSHRHHVVHHQSKAGTSYTYLQDLYPGQAKYTVTNSPISEYGVIGFEHGYSMAKPDALVIWEAQFGDFANNAIPILDCMIASGQWKWIRQCGMVVLLPHGLEGQGPEHSSARMERFLQLSADDADYLPPESPNYAINQLREINWIVANCTTPANIFHIWRRQIKLPFRKPLILFSPKSLLRHPEAKSKFEEMQEGTEFQRVISASGPASENPGNVKKLVFCTGKVFYDFIKEIRENKLEDQIAVARVEQICPFPYDLIQKEVQKYSNAKIAWGQEEHKNSGCWTYVQPRFDTAFKGEKDVTYIGRAPSASTASGNKIQYQNEYKSLIQNLLKIV